MPRNRPQLSITLPRNFTFHYTEGEIPKTPEREVVAPVPSSPHAYRVKRRSRPTVSSNTFQQHKVNQLHEDIPIPTVETVTIVEPEPLRPLLQQRVTEPPNGLLKPKAARPFLTTPRTPSVPRVQFLDAWKTPNLQDVGDSISRPMSACSIASDSSDDSNGSLTSFPSIGGSCTSPESDVADPFTFPSARKSKLGSGPALFTPTEVCQEYKVAKQLSVQWTADMDRHLWSIYMVYLQDPTVTPFKMLPGTAPPLGVCHRVAREARRTWRGGRVVSRKPSDPICFSTVCEDVDVSKISGSSDTINVIRSGSSTPTGTVTLNKTLWPKSGSSTRRRLRFLCKRKPTFAPHYQRLLQSRSPSPHSSSSRAHSLSIYTSSPLSQTVHPTPFSTRDIQVSLTTSTAATMQPDGPLARLAKDDPNIIIPPSSSTEQEWFNEPPVPWASPPAIPSDLGLDGSSNNNGGMAGPADARSLGSPFGYHTWGPSRSRQHLHFAASAAESTNASFNAGSALKSPIHLHDTFPYPAVLKRRAQHQLEDELSPGGSDMPRTLMEELFGPTGNRHRRVRSRGFSLGDVNSSGGRLQSLFNPPAEEEQVPIPGSEVSESVGVQPLVESELVRRLGSPFAGSSTGPSSRPSRHVASASLSAYASNHFGSIDQRIRQDDLDDDFRRALRE